MKCQLFRSHRCKMMYSTRLIDVYCTGSITGQDQRTSSNRRRRERTATLFTVHHFGITDQTCSPPGLSDKSIIAFVSGVKRMASRWLPKNTTLENVALRHRLSRNCYVQSSTIASTASSTALKSPVVSGKAESLNLLSRCGTNATTADTGFVLTSFRLPIN
jgi:ribosomal protein L32